MLLIIIKLIGIYLCIYGSSSTNYSEEYRQLLNSYTAYRFQFLTIIGLYLTLFTLTIILLHQTIALIFKRDLQLIRSFSTFLLALILPIELLITLTFWTLYLYDPSVIISEIVLKTTGIGLFQNLCMHLIPVILLIIEVLSFRLERRNSHVVVLCVFGAAYYLFARSIAVRENKWAYPFLDNRSESVRVLIVSFLTLVAVVFYEVVMVVLRVRDEYFNNFKNFKKKSD